jgi:hypothetical protein
MANLKGKREKIEVAKAKQEKEDGIVTRFGNYYSEEEWKGLQAGFEQEVAEAVGFITKMNLLKSQAMKIIEGSGLFTAAELPKVRAILENPGRAQFTDEEKREVLEAASKWFNEKMSKVR